MPKREITVDRAHRLAKLPFLPDNVPCDAIAKIHFYNVKEAQRARWESPLPKPYNGISSYADLSKHTMQARTKLVSFTKLYLNHNVIYCWGFPAKLLVTWECRNYTLFSVEEGMNLAKQWGLLPTDEQSSPPKASLSRVEPLWETAPG